MKTIVIILGILIGHSLIAQSTTVNQFELSYETGSLIPGIGSHDSFRPKIHIKNDSLSITYWVRTSKYDTIEKWGEYRDTVWVNATMTKNTYFKQSSIDSIVQSIKQIKHKKNSNDTLIDAYNPCIIDGGVIIIRIKYNSTHKLMFQISNTFDSTALQIVNIINPYLPEGHKIYVPYKEWQINIDCKEREKALRRKKNAN